MSADNEIKREQNSINRIAVFKERTTKFFADYENPTGSEDRLEICLIRDGCRAISQAEEIINRQQAEIDDLKRDTIPKLQSSLERANKYGREQDAEIKRLTEENHHFADIGKMYSEIKAEAVKEFAERLKEYLDDFYHTDEDALLDTADVIDNLVKEMAGEG